MWPVERSGAVAFLCAVSMDSGTASELSRRTGKSSLRRKIVVGVLLMSAPSPGDDIARPAAKQGVTGSRPSRMCQRHSGGTESGAGQRESDDSWPVTWGRFRKRATERNLLTGGEEIHAEKGMGPQVKLELATLRLTATQERGIAFWTLVPFSEEGRVGASTGTSRHAPGQSAA